MVRRFYIRNWKLVVQTIQFGMEEDREITDYALFVSKIYPVRLEDGSTENLKVELGDHSVFPLNMQKAECRREGIYCFWDLF